MARRHVTPELAHSDPDTYKSEVLQHMGDTTELGALAWNLGISNGTVDLSRYELNARSWVSKSNGAGRLILGTKPMTMREKSDVIFKGEELSYIDEVSRRLLHELGHGALFLAQHDASMSSVRELNRSVRLQTQNTLGLSALGSLPYYETLEDKAIEDTTELLTMRMIGQDHFDDYTAFLSDPKYEIVRASAGIITLDNVNELTDLVDEALVEALSKSR
jgi:hypothetical protein